MTHDYDDIISLPHPVSKRFPQMSLRDRAAQFAPFAALNGHSDAIRETAKQAELQMEKNDSFNVTQQFLENYEDSEFGSIL
ncbi:MAG: hypothetical protein J6V74_08560 [Bacteroidales bacterium]|nr:hypothetical protein [Bacteroidales bacterium]